ncbi:MAG: pilus assembly protein PilP [Cyanobium sp. MED843]|nr:pilus assembly protein PilP [Cyanobium sp. MED843]
MTRMVLNGAPDLLQGRRLELGLPAAPASIQPAWRLLLPGVVLCAVAVLVPLLMQLFLQRRERDLQRELDRLASVEQQLTKARSTLQRTTKRTESLQRDTAQITAQMVSVRSGSAFLEQLKRTTPTAVGLQLVAVQPSEVNITGSAQTGPLSGGWEQINAFALNLESLPAVPLEGAKVQQASAEDGGLVSFKLKLRVDEAVKPTPEQLRDLGADGLVRRYVLLKDLGLPL